MKIKTETGSIYNLNRGILTKEGDNLMAYKVHFMAPFEHGTVNDLEDLNHLEQGQPEIGKRMYFSGLGQWNVTTNVVEIVNENE